MQIVFRSQQKVAPMQLRETANCQVETSGSEHRGKRPAVGEGRRSIQPVSSWGQFASHGIKQHHLIASDYIY